MHMLQLIEEERERAIKRHEELAALRAFVREVANQNPPTTLPKSEMDWVADLMLKHGITYQPSMAAFCCELMGRGGQRQSNKERAEDLCEQWGITA